MLIAIIGLFIGVIGVILAVAGFGDYAIRFLGTCEEGYRFAVYSGGIIVKDFIITYTQALAGGGTLTASTIISAAAAALRGKGVKS